MTVTMSNISFAQSYDNEYNNKNGYNFNYRYRVTDIHISDNGTEFVNAIAQELYIVFLFAATGLTDNCTTSTFVHNNRFIQFLHKFSSSILSQFQ